MKLIVFTIWILVAVAGLAYHFGPGQGQMTRDQISRQLAAAHRHALDGEYDSALPLYDQALSKLPSEQRAKVFEVRIEKAKLQIEAGATPKAYADLVEMAPLVLPDKQLPASLKNELTSALGAAEFYGTWIMRLEGKPKEVWLPFAESSRQRFRYLSEATAPNSDDALTYRQNLERVIRLERMTIEELQGMPLPPAVSNAMSGDQGEGSGDMGEGKGPGKGKGKGEGQGPPTDDREGAGVGNLNQRDGS
ncbi:hypothetical protein [Bremerella cremea]|uniref:hypothetical protein n=1 Tax=Bremerella cremea TaxID=1031537 RepID=UPI0031F19D29